MKIEDYRGVLVFVQQVDGKITSVSYELVSKAAELANERQTIVVAAVLGHNLQNLERLASYGADKIIVADSEALDVYMTEPYTETLTQIIKQTKPEIVLFGATSIGRDLAPRVSARCRTGLTADCTKLEIDPETGNLAMTRPAFGGNIMATILCPTHRPQMATVRPGVMQKNEPDVTKKAEVILFHPVNLSEHLDVIIKEIITATAHKVDIEAAKVLVAGGRGMGSEENLKLLHDLAEVLGGEVASSRALVDAGMMAKDRQVGQTGKTVRPTLYFACGISGAIQHLAGMEEADVIVAINKDAEAPIFGVADYGVVGDAVTILPRLTEALRQLKAQK